MGLEQLPNSGRITKPPNYITDGQIKFRRKGKTSGEGEEEDAIKHQRTLFLNTKPLQYNKNKPIALIDRAILVKIQLCTRQGNKNRILREDFEEREAGDLDPGGLGGEAERGGEEPQKSHGHGYRHRFSLHRPRPPITLLSVLRSSREREREGNRTTKRVAAPFSQERFVSLSSRHAAVKRGKRQGNRERRIL